MTVPADLLLRGGRVLDPARGVDGPGDVAVRGGRIVDAAGRAGPTRTLDVSGLLVVPGLIDLHTHCFWGVSFFGVDPDALCLGRGVTTAVDTGSAGPRTFPGLRRYVIDRSRTRVLAFVHVAAQGMIAPTPGELEDLRWAAPDETVACAREHADVCVGVKVRLGHQQVGHDPRPALRAARGAADELSLPLMVHITDMPMPVGELLESMGSGDVVTHCFNGRPQGCIVDAAGRLVPGVREARARGVRFDVGHGMGSFQWEVVRAALQQDFPPDAISSDLHALNSDGPVFDQPTTLTKFLHLGMPLSDVVAATTSTPACMLGRPGLGSLAIGSPADITVLELVEGRFALADSPGVTEIGDQLLVPRWVVRDGELLETRSPVRERVERGAD